MQLRITNTTNETDYLYFDKDYDFLNVEIVKENITFSFRLFNKEDFATLQAMFDKALKQLTSKVKEFKSEEIELNNIVFNLATTNFALLTVNQIETILTEHEVKLIVAFFASF